MDESALTRSRCKMNVLAMAAWRLTWRFRRKRAKGLEVGSRVPDFELRDTGGKAHRLSAFAGQRVVLWFTNLCEDCRDKAPLLNELRRKGVAVLAVSILPASDPLPARIAGSCDFPILIDPQDVVAGILGLSHPSGACPMNNLFIVDETGKVLFRSHLSAIATTEFREACRQWLGV